MEIKDKICVTRPVQSKEELEAFIVWRDNLKKRNIKGIITYDVPRYYKWVEERDLFIHFLNR